MAKVHCAQEGRISKTEQDLLDGEILKETIFWTCARYIHANLRATISIGTTRRKQQQQKKKAK
jgi:hypothetical protein